MKAEDIPGIPPTTFGYSLSGVLDMDLNDYPDLIVGAYEDDRVFLIRSRPIIGILTCVQSSCCGDWQVLQDSLHKNGAHPHREFLFFPTRTQIAVKIKKEEETGAAQIPQKLRFIGRYVMTTSLRCCTFLFYLLIWRQFHQWNFSGATAIDEADFDDPFIFHVGCFWLLLLLLLAPRERQLKVTKCIASNHTRPGGGATRRHTNSRSNRSNRRALVV